MIGYVTLGTNDLKKACEFYDQLAAALGAQRVVEMEKMIMWGRSPKGPFLAVCTPYDDQPATRGNGTMVSLAVSGKEQVDQVHGLALELGASDEGAPGNRTDNFYGAYFRDLDGNKLCVFCMV